VDQPGGHTLIFTILIYLHILHKTHNQSINQSIYKKNSLKFNDMAELRHFQLYHGEDEIVW
jgi:hypothetical protein